MKYRQAKKILADYSLPVRHRKETMINAYMVFGKMCNGFCGWRKGIVSLRFKRKWKGIADL